MPKQQILPTWLALNNANFPTASGIQEPRTGQDFPVGGLKPGDYFDVTEQEANTHSLLSVGLLHHGRYRLVKVDSGAVAANVRTGTVGYCRIGTFVMSALINAPGSGGVPGTYSVPVPTGQAGGSGAVLQVIVGSTGSVTFVGVLSGGVGYTGNQTALGFTLTGIPGLTGATVQLQLNSTPNLVTDYFSATAQFQTGATGARPPRIIVFLNSITPGNYGFVQELGLATLLCNGAITPPVILLPVGTGLVAPAGTTVAANQVGEAVDTTTAANQLFKAYIQYPAICQD